jgi:hypothetical protein
MRGEVSRAIDRFDARVQAFGTREFGFGRTDLTVIPQARHGFECAIAVVEGAHFL